MRSLSPVILIITALLALGTAGALSPQVAEAQPSAQPAPGARAPGVRAPAAPGARATPRTVQTQVHPHGDIVEAVPGSKPGGSKGMALLFWCFAAATIGGALFVVTRRNLIAAVMGMVGSFLGISAVYMMLYANFLAVIQVLVYAGAIMVLFIFIIMILNRPEDEPVAPTGRAGQVVAGIAIVYLVGRLIMLLMRVQPPNQATAIAAPGPTAQGHDWGSVRAVGTDLFGPGLFPFEAISITLLVAVVGAIAIARPLHEGQDNQGEGPPPPAPDYKDVRPMS